MSFAILLSQRSRCKRGCFVILPVFLTHTYCSEWSNVSLSLFFFFREAEDSLSITVARCTSVNFYVPCVSFTLLDPKTLSFLWDIPQVINREGKGQRGQLPGSVAWRPPIPHCVRRNRYESSPQELMVEVRRQTCNYAEWDDEKDTKLEVWRQV